MSAARTGLTKVRTRSHVQTFRKSLQTERHPQKKILAIGNACAKDLLPVKARLADRASFALAGHGDAPQPPIVFIRLKHMLSPERYGRIKRDFLRVHRQYVLDADVRAPFDFTMMTAGPLPAASFANAA